MISKQEVQHIAKLARLQLTEQEIGKMQKDLTAILDYFGVLKKAPKVKKQLATGNWRLAHNGLRKDEVKERPAGLAGDLVQAAPEKKDGYVKVKAIL